MRFGRFASRPGHGSSDEARNDEMAFPDAIIRIAEAMDRLKIGTERSRDIARIFRGWMEQGI